MMTESSMRYLTSINQDIELNDIPTNIGEQQCIDSNKISSHEKCNSIKNWWHKATKIFACLNVEERGIERISSEDRTDVTIINTAMIWVSANIIIPCFAAGTLGPAVFELDLNNSFVTIIIFNLLGTLPIAGMAYFGPASGLRTMIFSRYSWGYYAVNGITGAQTLRVVFNDSFPITVGIIIIAIITMIVSFIGYKWIHIYERYSWIPVFIGYCILAGVGAKYFTNSKMVFHNATISNNSRTFRLELSRILTFGSVIFGTACSWCPLAADYNTYFPESTSQQKIFLLTYISNFVSMTVMQLLGVAAYTGTHTNQNWKQAYEINNVGGLLGAILSPLRGFGKFILILFAISTVVCNIPNLYSLSLSAQVIAPILSRIPRFLYTVIGTVAYVLLAIVAASKFNDALTSVMGISSYWSAIFMVIVFEDHLLFRCCSFPNYNFSIWNSSKLLPISLAAILSAIVGVAGIILGMSQIWFSGPIAKVIAENTDIEGTDIGFEVGLIFTAVTFPLFRLIELYFIRR
ncbi:unnamed protein product [Rotaria sp. Silwood2]|nr:unnamed protein product [Rotaria sp. Silwood2]CAF4352255.1 unnamed protein product [Rotaria sp. Silwood2]